MTLYPFFGDSQDQYLKTYIWCNANIDLIIVIDIENTKWNSEFVKEN